MKSPLPWLAAALLCGPGHAQEVSSRDTRVHLDRLARVTFLGRPHGPNWLTQPQALPLPAGPEEWKLAAVTSGSGQLLAHWQAGPLDLHWKIQAFQYGPVRLSATLSNRGPDRQLGCWDSFRWRVANGAQLRWVEKGSEEPSDRGDFLRLLAPGQTWLGQSSGYVGDGQTEQVPWFSLYRPGSREGLQLGLEFSGRVRMQAKASQACLDLVGGLDPSGGVYRSRLSFGECWQLPPVLLGCWRGEADDSSRQMHRYVREHMQPPNPRGPLVTNNSWGSGMAVNEALCRRMIRDAGDLGVELFGLDAGWFRGLGDWRLDAGKFPSGWQALRTQARRSGLTLGLWLAWTQGGKGGPGTFSFVDPKQREDFVRDYPPDYDVGWEFIGGDLCLGSASVRNRCRQLLQRTVQGFGLQQLEHDQRMVVSHCLREDHEHTQHPSDVAYRSCLGYYALQEELLKNYPELLLENCVNGGRMLDLGAVRRAHYLCLTDRYFPLAARRSFYDLSQIFPPEMCEVYLEDVGLTTEAQFLTMLRSGMSGWWTLMCDSGGWSPHWRELARQHIDFYKRELRPLIQSGSLYRVGQRPSPQNWDANLFVAADRSRAVLLAFRGELAAPQISLDLPGLSGTYRVQTFEGQQLAPTTDRIRLNQPQPGGSLLLTLQRCD